MIYFQKSAFEFVDDNFSISTMWFCCAIYTDETLCHMKFWEKIKRIDLGIFESDLSFSKEKKHLINVLNPVITGQNVKVTNGTVPSKVPKIWKCSENRLKEISYNVHIIDKLYYVQSVKKGVPHIVPYSTVVTSKFTEDFRL